jgi:predicted RNase H-like HicB family nuclease
MKTYNFKVVVEPDEDFDGNHSGWHAYCPALKKLGGATWGETREEALKHLNEVIHMIVEELISEGKPLPQGSGDSVEVYDVSEEDPRIAVTV